ncbi:hypothetical protein [Methanobacterium sp. ACI-7]|uniref:hypothetical protein n=1 Tax=unclassified Methanobacterium TaxID=2627676 RepID=UPI0039C19649
MSSHQGFRGLVGPYNQELVLSAGIIGIMNIFLLMALLYIYWGSYREFKSRFILGIILFIFLLLIQNVLFTSFIFIIGGFKGPGMGIPLFITNIIQFVGLSILLKISLE